MRHVGVDNTGWRRGSRTATQKQWVTKLARRVRRLKQLTAWSTKARTLWNTNVGRTLGYGISGHGVAPSVAKLMRARTAGVSNCLPGSYCKAIKVVVHELRDPGSAIPCQTIKDSIGLWRGMTRGQRHEARVAWHRTKRRLDKLGHPEQQRVARWLQPSRLCVM